jgi:capsular polysaccharide biosynthesis protein
MFKKKLQNYFKKFFQILFKFIYGKIVYKEKNLDHKNITISKIDNSIIQKFHNKSYQVYQIKNARVYNDTVENVAIINQNQILDKISYQQQNGKLCQANSSVILSKGTPRIKKKIKSNLFILSQGASGNENYFHWMFDIIPKLRILNEVYKYEKIDFFYFSKLKKWQKDILDIMGLKNIKILNSNVYRHVQAKEIIAVDHPWYEKGYILDEVNNIPHWIVEWLREIFISKAEHFDSNDKIFIDRSESKFKHCQIINDIEVSNFLESKGFTKYKVGQLPFKRQISLFKNAKIIVGAHGAAFANLIFCEPRTKIIEIKPKNHPNYFSRKISEINNLNYELIETEIIPDDKKNNGDIYLDLKYLEKIV